MEPSADAASPSLAPASLADGALRRLDPGFVRAERFSGRIATAAMALALPVGLAVLALGGGLHGWALGAAAAGGVAAWALLAWTLHVWPRLEFERTSYRVSPWGLEIARGVLWRSVTAVPRSRVQHTDVSQGPVQRRYGVATLVVHTAGAHDSQVNLAGLRREQAFLLRDFLLAEDGRDGG